MVFDKVPTKEQLNNVIQTVTEESFEDFDSRCERAIAFVLTQVVEHIRCGKRFPFDTTRFPKDMWDYTSDEAHNTLNRRLREMVGNPFAFSSRWWTSGGGTYVEVYLCKWVKKKTWYGKSYSQRVDYSYWTEEEFGTKTNDPCLERAIKELDAFLNPTTPTIREDNKA